MVAESGNASSVLILMIYPLVASGLGDQRSVGGTGTPEAPSCAPDSETAAGGHCRQNHVRRTGRRPDKVKPLVDGGIAGIRDSVPNNPRLEVRRAGVHEP